MSILYLLPNRLGKESKIDEVIPPQVGNIISQLDGLVAENAKRARDFISHFRGGKEARNIPIAVFDRNKAGGNQQFWKELIAEIISKDENWGIVSDCGCPGIADPGAGLVRLAHLKGVKVVPLVGPSSIVLALMASGLNGQQFAFHGYLPQGKSDRVRKLKQLENESQQKNQTQIFIEAPFRNDFLVEDMFKSLQLDTRVCIASDLTLDTEEIVTKRVWEWRKAQKLDLRKKPAVFLLLAPRREMK